MPDRMLFMIALVFLLSVGAAGFHYFYKTKGPVRKKVVLGFLRFLSIFALLLLLLNPQLERISYSTQKPELLIVVDHSASVKHLEEEDRIRKFIEKLAGDPEIKERFHLNFFTFGDSLSKARVSDFNEKQTDIPAALKRLDRIYASMLAPTLLLTDGNYTTGKNPFAAAADYGQPLIPVVLGDTAHYADLEISRVSYNKHGFLKNFLPVEVIVKYSGKQPVQSELKIKSGIVTLFSRKLSFDGENDVAVVRADLPSVALGVNQYVARLRPFGEEKNKKNNIEEFAVEIIDERPSVLVIYSILHPDLQALKKSISSEQGRLVHLQHISSLESVEESHDLVILYQPDNRFRTLMEGLAETNQDTWIITGPETDLELLNDQQKVLDFSSGDTGEYFPELNENFDLFQNLEFEDFPPLLSRSDTVSVRSSFPVETLLFRRAGESEGLEPLLAMAQEDQRRTGFLIGSGIWKWRSQSFENQGSYEEFDAFIGKIIRLLSIGGNKQRLRVEHELLYKQGRDLQIFARYLDKNYRFDPNADLLLRVQNEITKEKQEISFVPTRRKYAAGLRSLAPGTYTFQVVVAGEDLKSGGSFRVLPYHAEAQYTRSRPELLQNLAENHGQQIFYLDQVDRLKQKLLSSESYQLVRKSHKKNVPLIDWYYLLVIISVTLSAEWFLRKYYGYI